MELKADDKLHAAPLFYTSEGAAYDVPVEGSLGLLAYGYKGLMAWRQKRALGHEKEEEKSIPSSKVTPVGNNSNER